MSPSKAKARILVCGSRDWGSYSPIRDRLMAFMHSVTIVHGAASRRVRGVEQSADMLAHAAATRLGHEIEQHPANWQLHGKAAGPIRNNEMLDSGIDLVLAFQRAGSKGTQHTIDGARRRGIAVEVHTPAGVDSVGTKSGPAELELPGPGKQEGGS